MKKTKYILTSLAILFAIGCKKIKPPVDESQANEPIYKIQGLMNGDSLNLYVDDSSVFISAEPYNFNGIEAYSSTISDIENDFLIRMIILRPERFIDEDGVKLIENKDVDFIINQELCLWTTFGNTDQNNYYHLNIDGKEFSGGNFEVYGYGIYTATAKFPNINSQNYQIEIPIGFNNTELKPKINLFASAVNSVIFESEINSLVVNHNWYIDDTLISTDDTFSETLNYGIHTVKHEVIDEFGNLAKDEAMFYVNDNTLEWQMKIHENVCDNPNYVANNYGRGFIEIEKDGEVFTTLHNKNNTAYKLKISNIEYIVNTSPQTKKIIKFDLNFDAELKNEDKTKTILLKGMKGVFQIQLG
ncbi:MAG TPA: hypothetical protein EYG85_11530 [Crocinitomix sp.]|nr:hypothetical protein [Crocinitomix sp.]